MGLVEERKKKRMLEKAGQVSTQSENMGIVEKRKQERAQQIQGASFSAPAQKTAEQKEADINRREKNRSVQYSMLPEVRAGAIKRAEAAGDTEKVRELTHAEDIEVWAKEQTQSDSVKKEAQRRYDEEFLKAKARGDENPAIAAMKAGDAYLDLYRGATQKTRDNVYSYRQDEKKTEMEGVQANSDFEERAAVGREYTSDSEYKDGKYNLSSPFGTQAEVNRIMSFVNGTTDFAGQYGEDKARVDEMTEGEKDTIRYFAANGELEKVKEYYKLLERSLNKRVQEVKNKETYEKAYENPGAGVIKNVGASFGTVGAYIANAGNAVGNIFRDEYVPTDINSTAFAGAHTAKQTSRGVSDRAYDAAGGGNLGEVARFFTETGLSMANFLSKAPLGPTGAMIAMGADTAGQTTLDVLERGGTPGQAFLLSTAAGTIEALTEKMPLDNLFRTAKEVGKTGAKATIKSVLKQAGMEATEEVVSELANTALDIAVMREKSEYQSYITELEKSGMSREEAEKEAFFQFFGMNLIKAGAGGALSGAAMGGGASAISAINTNINRSRVGGGFTKTEFSGKITNKQIRALDAIGRALGVNISIGAPTGDGKGAYNGYYENGNIVIAQDAKNPLEVVLCHEVTHHMKNTAPAEYTAFLELAINASEKLSGAEKGELINRYKTAYSEGTQSEFSDIQALDEIAADFTSRIVKDVKMFERLAQDNRTVATKLLDGIRDFIAKVKSTFSYDKAKADTASQEKYGASISELEAAVAQFEKMLETTEAAVASGNINTAGTDADGGRQYSINESLLSDLQDVLTYENKNDRNELRIGTTSDFLVNELGAESLQVTMPKSKAYAAMVSESEAKRAGRYSKDLNYHELGADLLYDALVASENPVVAFVDENTVDKKNGKVEDRSNRIVLVTDKTKDGNNIVVIMQVNAPGTVNGGRVQVNKDITVFDRKSLGVDISRAMSDNRLLYFDKKRSQNISAGKLAANSPGAIQKVDFKNNISRFWANVNWKKEGGKSVFEAPEENQGTAFAEAYSAAVEKSNRKNSLKTEDLLSPEHGKGTDTSSEKPEGLTPSPQGKGSEGESYIEETGLDKYFDDIEERAQVIQDGETDIGQAEDALMTEPKEDKNFFEKVKELPEKVRGSISQAKRKMVNSGDAIRKIAKTVKDEHLYGTFNRTRSAANIVSDMLQNKQTNIRGQKVGESLEGIILPIKEKGKEYFRNFNFYLLLKHNVSRMSLENKKAEELARAELQQYIKENGDLATMTHEQRKGISRREDDRGLRARKYLELEGRLRAAEERNKPIVFENNEIPLDADKSRRKAAELLRKNPGFAEDEANVRKYLDNLMQYRIDSGLITQEEADYYKKKYPDYIPTYRNTEENMTWITGMVNVGTAINKAKGGNEQILPLDVTLAAMTNKVVKNGQKNILANKVLGLYDKHAGILSGYITDVKEGGRSLDTEFEEIGEEKTLGNTVGFYKDGKRIELTVTPELFEAFDALSQVPKEQSAFVKWWAKKVDTYKKLITTYDITFGVRNFLKDFQDALIYSTDTISFLKNFGKAYKEIATNGEMWELYQAAGGLYSSRFEDIQNEGIKKEGKLKKIKEGVAFLNVMIEQAPRLAEFMSVYEKGDPNSSDTLSDALLAAADVTTNFGESGTVGKVINRYFVPFLNPSLQGTAKLVRTFAESKNSKAWIALAVKCTMFGLTAGFFNDLMNKLFGGDDDDYENLPDRIKDNYFLFPVGDSGKYVKLPKGRVVAAFGIVADRIRDGIKGEKVDVGEALSGIADNTLPENPLTNNIFKAATLDAQLFNKKSRGRTWYGTDIENETLQSLPAGERFDSSTDYVSKTLGKVLGVSPKKLNYILQQYTGGVGRMVLPMLTPSEQMGDNIAGTIGLGIWSAIASNFSTDSKLSNKVSGEFYDAVDKAEQAKNSSKGTLADKVVYKHLNRERNQMSSYNKTIRDAEVDENLTSKERRAAVRVASAEKTEYQNQILDNLPEYRESVEKYLKKYPGKDEEKKAEYAYREANRALYGEEYAIRVNGGSDVHKKAEEKVKRGKTTWKKYYEEYFGKTDRRYEAISDRFDISYSDFEKIENAISKNSSKADEVAAIQKLGYKNSIARRIYTLYHDAE